MKTAPSEELQGVAEEILEVEVDENRIIGDPNAPNKDTNTPLGPYVGAQPRSLEPGITQVGSPSLGPNPTGPEPRHYFRHYFRHQEMMPGGTKSHPDNFPP